MGVAQNPRSAEWYRSTYGDASTSGVVLAAAAGLDNAIVVKSAKHTIMVQAITINIKTSAAQTITIRDDNGTPIDVLVIEASAAAGTIRSINFGAKGVALTEGKNLDIVNTAGPAYSWSIEAYQVQTSASASTTADRTI